MPVGATVQVVGLKQTINGLGKIDKQLQKDFKSDATQIAQPAINAGKAVYKEVPLSNFAKDWTSKPQKAHDALKGLALTKRRTVSKCVLILDVMRSALFLLSKKIKVQQSLRWQVARHLTV